MDAGLIYGRGISFPVGLSPFGRFELSEGPDNIAEALLVILATEPGERVMLPGFGAGLRRFLFEPNNAATHRLIEERVTRAIERWEPRVRLEAARVGADPFNLTAARVEVRYRLVATGSAADLTVTVAVGQGAPSARNGTR